MNDKIVTVNVKAAQKKLKNATYKAATEINDRVKTSANAVKKGIFKRSNNAAQKLFDAGIKLTEKQLEALKTAKTKVKNKSK